MIFDSAKLEPNHEILEDTTVQVPLETGADAMASIRIIEWRTGKHRAVYFGEDAERFVVEASGLDLENQATFSAYVTWPGFDVGSLADLGLGDMAPDPAGPAWRATRKTVKEHFASRRRARRVVSRDITDENRELGLVFGPRSIPWVDCRLHGSGHSLPFIAFQA